MPRSAVLAPFAAFALACCAGGLACTACDGVRRAGDPPDADGACPNPDERLVAFYGTCAVPCLHDVDCPRGTVCTCGGSWAPFHGDALGTAFGACVAPCIADDDCAPVRRCRTDGAAVRCVDAAAVCGADEFCHAACLAGDFCDDGATPSNDACSETTSGFVCTFDGICG